MGWGSIADSLLQDVRHGVRILARDVGFTTVAVLALALGIGVDTAVTFSYPDYEAYRDSVRSFSGLIAFTPEHMTLSNAGGIVSQRTSAAESRLGRLGLLSSGASKLVGMCLAVGAAYVLRRLLYGIRPVDGLSFIGVSVLFLSIAVLAAYVPSRRALRVDPMVALRYE